MNHHDFSEQMLEHLKLFHKNLPPLLSQPMRGERFILQYLLDSHGQTLPSEISAAMETSTARTAAALNSLEEKELITRTIHKEDRRQILVSLTAKGVQTAKEQTEQYLQNATRLFNILGEDDAGEFIRIIKKIGLMHHGDEALPK